MECKGCNSNRAKAYLTDISGYEEVVYWCATCLDPDDEDYKPI